MKLLVWLVVLAAGLVSSTVLLAEDVDVKALAREACKSADVKKKFLDMVEEARGKEERAIVGFEVERDCAHFDLPDKPKNDTGDTAADATHTDQIHDVHFSADGKTVLSASEDGSVRLWDVATGKPISRIELPVPNLPKGYPPHAAYARSALFIGDGSRIAVAQDYGPILVFETATGKQLNAIPISTKYDMAPRIATSLNGMLFIAAKDGFVYGVDPTTNVAKLKLGGHSNEATSIAISESAGLIATGADLGELSLVLIRKLDTGAPVAEIQRQDKRHNAPVAMAFARDGKNLAVSYGGTVVVYDTASRKERATMIVHPLYNTFDLAFTADGSGLITCQSHPILWDTSTGKVVRHFGPFSDLCNAVDVSPDGRYAVTGSLGSDVRIWEIATGAFERRLGRNVKPKE